MILVWHRSDLRTHDHPALFAAAQESAVIPFFVLDPNLLTLPYSGKNRIQFLYKNLSALNESYKQIGTSLVVRAGKPDEEILKLATETNATFVFALRSYEPIGRERDKRVAKILAQAGIQLKLFDGDCVIEPGRVKNGSGDFYKVFTPFYRAWMETSMNAPLPAPKKLVPHNLKSLTTPKAEEGIVLPAAGEESAIKILQNFLKKSADKYQTLRDIPSIGGTSFLSSFFHLGVLSPRLAVQMASAQSSDSATAWVHEPATAWVREPATAWVREPATAWVREPATAWVREPATAWVRELCWRDFYKHILWFEPRLENQAFKPEWNSFPWRDHTTEAKKDFEAWQNGQTGLPIVDAGMRQLAATGWMHNRVRMIVASFLCKHLLISWQAGASVFNDQLIDGDLASNNGGWQWSAGCGVDAAPYFRVFNPVSQGQKFDAEAKYIRQFVPELAGLATADIHQPSLGIFAPNNYPTPIVDLKFGRERFLDIAKQHLRSVNTVD